MLKFYYKCIYPGMHSVLFNDNHLKVSLVSVKVSSWVTVNLFLDFFLYDKQQHQIFTLDCTKQNYVTPFKMQREVYLQYCILKVIEELIEISVVFYV